MHQPGRAAEIKAIGIGKSFGRFRALNDLSLDIGRGEFLVMPTKHEPLRWRLKRWFPDLYFRKLLQRVGERHGAH